jgi:hypothetical protein
MKLQHRKLFSGNLERKIPRSDAQSTNFCASGNRLPTLNALDVTFNPGGACFRLYSF